ncbi:HNH endonuclease [Halorubrum sp. 2020YC2]|nr:HNH endonuclease [Halorubrum sp. 2020YC2]
MNGCIICGTTPTDGAHVKPKETFDSEEIRRGRDRVQNIISLCQNHHRLFDRGKIGICPNKSRFIIQKPDSSEIECQEIQHQLNIRDEYISYRNSSCEYKVKFRLGILPQDYGSMCDSC